MVNLTELKKLAEAATPGPWKASTHKKYKRLAHISQDNGKCNWTVVEGDMEGSGDALIEPQDSAFIAAAKSFTAGRSSGTIVVSSAFVSSR